MIWSLWFTAYFLLDKSSWFWILSIWTESFWMLSWSRCWKLCRWPVRKTNEVWRIIRDNFKYCNKYSWYCTSKKLRENSHLYFHKIFCLLTILVSKPGEKYKMYTVNVLRIWWNLFSRKKRILGLIIFCFKSLFIYTTRPRLRFASLRSDSLGIYNLQFNLQGWMQSYYIQARMRWRMLLLIRKDLGKTLHPAEK